MTLAIVDCGIGNLRSVQKAFEATGTAAVLTADHGQLREASHLVVPGVGAFGDFMTALGRIGVETVLADRIAQNTPLLGICVGMQVLFEEGLEFGRHRGLGWIEGRVIPFDADQLTVPHVGWNQARSVRPDPLLDAPDEPWFYFVHSFHAETSADCVVARTDYGHDFPSIVRSRSVWGVQFHPEKSQKAGLDLLARFAALPSPLVEQEAPSC
ncbi:MAG: imidazole glycerol phosphate synthase subunit HisH [Proteobacteria bacterium]|nr:imidazole glycerol phosphate synthase subunit HisH [Pseudomonadota bacterium]